MSENSTTETENADRANQPGQTATAAVQAETANRVASLETQHETLAGRVEDIAAKVEDIAARGATIAQTGVLGGEAAVGGGIVQEIVDFLHWMFPVGVAGMGGTPASGARPTPGVPSWALAAQEQGAARTDPNAPVASNRPAP